MAIRTGIASVTFRRLAVREIVDLVADCGLEGIEWGGDVHVPPGDVELAREVSAVTRDAGLRVSSYGSYWRAGEQDRESAEAVLRSAVALEAPVLRIWAGARPSAEADEAYRELVVEQTLMLARMAFAHGIVTAFEYHSHSLTDCTRSALQLLRQVREQGVRTYWQPPGELGDTELIRSFSTGTRLDAVRWSRGWNAGSRCCGRSPGSSVRSGPCWSSCAVTPWLRSARTRLFSGDSRRGSGATESLCPRSE
jgi:hypothetical protein